MMYETAGTSSSDGRPVPWVTDTQTGVVWQPGYECFD